MALGALNWRGIFGVHTWIATKPPDATQYTIHHVIGWRAYRNLPVVVSAPGIPDGRWFGNEPELLLDIRGDVAAAAIPKIVQATATYPYADEYQLWPGPNSNTFMAYVGRQVPELKMDLPATAIGKDYPINGSIIDRRAQRNWLSAFTIGSVWSHVGARRRHRIESAWPEFRR